MTRLFSPATRDALQAQGWRFALLPDGLTLETLRRTGASFKGTKFFDQHASDAHEESFEGGDIAYRPGLMPDSLNRTYDEIPALLDGLNRLLPPGVTAALGSAAAYAWLLDDHHTRSGEWLLPSCFTWTLDGHRSSHLVTGAFGRTLPILVSPLPEGRGRGVGVMPLIVPEPASAPMAHPLR